MKSLEKSEKFYCGVTSKYSTADYAISVEAYCKCLSIVVRFY